MRSECYMQSMVASGKRPEPVDSAKTPWAVLPPIFNAVRVEGNGGYGNGEVVMGDEAESGMSFFSLFSKIDADCVVIVLALGGRKR